MPPITKAPPTEASTGLRALCALGDIILRERCRGRVEAVDGEKAHETSPPKDRAEADVQNPPLFVTTENGLVAVDDEHDDGEDRHPVDLDSVLLMIEHQLHAVDVEDRDDHEGDDCHPSVGRGEL